MPKPVLILNGPNLNLLGQRQPEVYGRETLADVERDCAGLAAELGLEVRFLQSNWEGQIVDWIHEGARGRGGDRDQPGGVDAYLGGDPRCAQRLRGAGDRGAHLERAQA